MSSVAVTRVWSDLPIPPGEVLREEIEALGINQTQLAAALGRPVQVVNEIVRGKKAITQETALELERVLGIGAHVWAGLESAYRMTLARNREREQLETWQDWLREFPVAEMAKRGWVAKVRDKREQVRELLRYFGVANVAAYRTVAPMAGGSFRFTEKAKVSEGALAAWLRKGEMAAQTMETHGFQADKLHRAAQEARALTSTDPKVFVPRLERLFSEAGVAFVVVQELPKTGANGVARWLNPGKALIQINLRYRWADVFWFTLFHEVAHLLKHKRKHIILEGKGVHKDPLMEEEADRWAADLLIPPNAWQEFVNEDNFDRSSVVGFAKTTGIDPGIVVGRLHREHKLPYAALTDLEPRLLWTGST